MEFTIRQATIQDFSTIQKLNHQLFVSDYTHDNALNLDWPLSDEGVAYYKKKLSDPAYGVFVAVDPKNNILGYVIGSSENKFRYRRVVVGELENMFVVPQVRRKGVGKALVARLQQWLKQRGVERVYVSAYGKNENAIHFYDACGFALWEVGLEMKL